MSGTTARTDLAKALLRDVAPDELEFLEAYEAAVSSNARDRRAGTGMGLPPEIVGAIGMVAVLVGRSLFDKLFEWSRDLAWEVAKKFVADAGAVQLKKWLLSPSTASLDGVLTASGQMEILSIVERDAQAAGLSREDTNKLTKAVLKRLRIGESTGG